MFESISPRQVTPKYRFSPFSFFLPSVRLSVFWFINIIYIIFIQKYAQNTDTDTTHSYKDIGGCVLHVLGIVLFIFSSRSATIPCHVLNTPERENADIFHSNYTRDVWYTCSFQGITNPWYSGTNKWFNFRKTNLHEHVDGRASKTRPPATVVCSEWKSPQSDCPWWPAAPVLMPNFEKKQNKCGS